MTDTLDLSISVSCAEWTARVADVERLCGRVLRAAYAACGDRPGTAEAGVVLADDGFVRDLNRDYRGKDAPTNVLSFASLDAPGPEQGLPPGTPVPLGDVVIAFETTDAEARRDGKSLSDHLSHLLAHGMLHLMGYDHQTDEAAAEMEALEARILADLGIADPYASRES